MTDLLLRVLVTAALACGTMGVSAAQSNDALRVSFVEPPMSARPMIRWWWPGAAVAPGEIEREIGVLADAGFGGAEIQPMVANLPGLSSQDQLAMHDYPGQAFFKNVAVAASAAQARGLRVDYTFGSGWPTGGEAITPKIASLELTMARVEIQGPQQGPIALPQTARTKRIGSLMEQIPGAPKLDAPTQKAIEDTSRVVAVIAVRGTSPATSPYRESSPLTGAAWPSVTEPGTLQAGSPVILTDRLNPDGTIRWQVPAGTWQLFVFKQYVADIRVLGGVGRGPQLVADHFARAAFDAHAARVGDPLVSQAKPYLGRGLSSIFIDSLELPADLFWTEDFLQQFQRRRGYDLTPYLPLIVQPGWHAAYSAQQSAPMYEMDDIGPRVRADYRQTVSDLMIENFYQPVTDWAHQHGLMARIQAHGMPGDVLHAYGVADVPETEDMSGGRNQHTLRQARSAADIYGRRTVSAESFATFARPYEFSPENLKRWSDALFAAGVNQIWMHGFAYSFHANRWPGWYPFATSDFSPGFSSMINEANPQWPNLAPLNRYIARMQAVLQSTDSVVPVAIYTSFVDDVSAVKVAAALGDGLRAQGFDYDHINADGILRSRSADKHVLTPGGARFSAIVLPEVSRLRAEVAEQIAKFAANGVRIVFVGTSPWREEGFVDAASRDERVRRAMQAANGTTVATAADVSQALRAAGVRSNLTFTDTQTTDFIEKRSGSRTLYFLRSDDEAPRDVSFVTDAAGGAQLWNAWDGTTRPLAVVRTQRGAQVRLTLPRYGAALIVFDPEFPVVRDKDSEAPRQLRELTLGPSGWRAQFAGHGSNGDARSLSLDLPHLRDWREIEGLADFAGVGSYQFKVRLDQRWVRKNSRVLIDLGAAYDSVVVTVNDQAFEPLIMRPFILDISRAVRSGENRVEVKVMNAPQNALVSSKGNQAPERLISGLIGPVRLVQTSR